MWCPAGIEAGQGLALADETARLRAEWCELRKHMLAVQSFWTRVITMHKQGDLPTTFFQGGWFFKADNYRKVMEPLYIANWYSAHFNMHKDYMGSARPNEFAYIDQLAKKKAEDDERGLEKESKFEFIPSTRWAEIIGAEARRLGPASPELKACARQVFQNEDPLGVWYKMNDVGG